MRILLPPSEAKHRGGRGKPITSRTPHPLDAPRGQILSALTELIGTDAGAAARALLLPASSAAQALDDNARAGSGPTCPAVERYAGVVYEGLSVTKLSKQARRSANRSVIIFSGLFGAVRGGDAIPLYRVPAKAVLPGLGVAGTYWRPRLQQHLPALLDSGLVLDLRSGDYVAMWQPRPGERTGRGLVRVRVLSKRPDGSHGVISYPSKLAKGRLAAAVLEAEAAGQAPHSASEVADLWLAIGGRDAVMPAKSGGIGLDLLE